MALVIPQAGQGCPVIFRIKQRLRPFSSRCGPINVKTPPRTLKVIKRPRGVDNEAASTASLAAEGATTLKPAGEGDLERL